ncbi:MAG: T9SS type A sorting domain-containing protein [Muribaculaceae bacterium]|nr:T9SS type A sorting domain-containing protein [Muribaculaceae bacterium]
MKKFLSVLALGASLSAMAVAPNLNSVRSTDIEKNTRIAEKAVSVAPFKVSDKVVNPVQSLSKLSFKGAAPSGELTEDTPYYLLPDAVFYSGYLITEDGQGYMAPISQDGTASVNILAPAYTPLTWYNLSYIASEQLPEFNWLYYTVDYDAQEVVEATSTDINLVTPAMPYLQYYSPTLYIGDKSFSQGSYTTFGGSNYFQFSDGSAYVGASLLHDIADKTNYEYLYSSVFTKDNATWSEIMGSEVTVDGLGVIIPQPAHEYGIVGVTFLGYIAQYVSESIKAEIYELTEIVDEEAGTVSYQLGEKLAGGYLPKDYIPTNEAGWVNLEIPLIEEDGELSYSTYLNVDGPVYVQITGFDAAAGDQVYPMATFTTNDACLYSSASVMNVGGNLLPPYGIQFNDGSFVTNFLIGVDAYYTWLNDADEETKKVENLVADVDGDEFAYSWSGYFDLAGDVPVIAGEGLYDWYTVEISEADENYFNEVLIIVDALPAGVTGRQDTLTIEVPGAKRTFIISQGDAAGIDNVADDAAKADAKVVGDNLVVVGQGNVEVYNVAGQLVKSAVAEGEATIGVSDLAKGVYVVKVGNATAKVVK